ncbi:MAG: ORF6N domain-containing protein [Bacteroidales bacterium]|nr:ORF6N domain-containing protein [Bacteroidales bacterium]
MELIKLDDVNSKIVVLRNTNVILDSDVAALYGVETKIVNQAVRNNPQKFPEGYIFELSTDEFKALRSKNLTLKKQGRGQHAKYAPKAFTKKGCYMLATILKSPKATQTTIAIIEAFEKMQEMSNSIVDLMKDHENEQKQKTVMQKGEALFGEIIGTALDTVDTETSFELNLAAFKIKHTVKRSRKQ